MAPSSAEYQLLSEPFRQRFQARIDSLTSSLQSLLSAPVFTISDVLRTSPLVLSYLAYTSFPCLIIRKRLFTQDSREPGRCFLGYGITVTPGRHPISPECCPTTLPTTKKCGRTQQDGYR